MVKPDKLYSTPILLSDQVLSYFKLLPKYLDTLPISNFLTSISKPGSQITSSRLRKSHSRFKLSSAKIDGHVKKQRKTIQHHLANTWKRSMRTLQIREMFQYSF